MPLVAISAAVVLALVAVAFLIFFIHHTAASIQASYLLRAITKETLSTVEELFPERNGQDKDVVAAESQMPRCQWHAIDSQAFGYVQSTDSNALAAMAVKRNMMVCL